MFLAVPTSAGVRLRTFPVATTLLAMVLIGVAACTLPERGAVREARRRAERVLAERTAKPADGAGPHAELHAVRRAELAAREAALADVDPVERWGYGPDSPAWRAMSALFVHGDWLHLSGNLIGLVVVGVLVESAIGPLAMLLLALGGGALALQVDARCGTGVLVGASSAVAVLLGAASFLLRRARVGFAYVYFEYLRPERGRFELPALLLAGVWVVQQVVGLALAARGRADDVAYGSHLVGFALGLLAAALLPERALVAARRAPAAAPPDIHAQKQPS